MKKNLLLLLLVLVFSSCESQMGTAVKASLRNIMSGDAFINSSGDEAFRIMKEEYLSKSSNGTVKPTCTTVDSINNILGMDPNDLSNIKDKLCSCEAWGTCDSKSCSCDVLCPKGFGIFKSAGQDGFNSKENTLAFHNGNNRFTSDSTYKGYCWGISLITQKFNRLATFSSQPKRFDGIDQEVDRLNDYKNIIARINNNEPVTIPGFSSLWDFSSDPEVKNLLEDSAKEEWAKNAMTTQGLAMISSDKTPPKNEMNAMFDDIEFRLKNNLSPAIVYNPKGSKTDAHVLLASGFGVNPMTNERHICLRDNNYSAEISLDCTIKMILKNDGTVVNQIGTSKYNSNLITQEIGKVALTHSENSSTIEQGNNLHTKCSGEKGCTKN